MEEINPTEAVTESAEVETPVSNVSETEEVETTNGEIVEDMTAAPEGIEADAAEIAAPTSIDDLTPKMKLNGKVSRLELYGAFIDIGVGTNALIHISKLGKDHVNRVSDVLQVGDDVAVWVDKVNPDQGQIMVTMVEPLAVDWSDLKKGQTYTGTVTRLENYGAFVDIGAEREGLVHISEISHDYVKHPSEVLAVGDEVQVEVLDFNRRKRRIDLSIKNLQEKPESLSAVIEEPSIVEDDVFEEELEEVPTAMEVALRRAMGDEPVDAAIEGQKKRNRRKDRKQKRQKAQEDLLNRTLHFQQDS
jgi:small subunit ribosomal protein S1